MEKVIVKVKGMSCTGCENRIKNALSDIEGIKKVDANHKTGEVKCTLTKEVPMCIMKDKINELGFEVIEG